MARATAKWLLLLGLVAHCGCATPGGGVWPAGNSQPPGQLGHPPLEQRAAELDPGPQDGFRFVAFGDQRALADGEWQTLMQQIGQLAARDPRVAFMVDTGDIVQDGLHGDQFPFLASIVAPAQRLPYLVCVGNHEVRNNRSWEARCNTAAFLRPLDPSFAPQRMYYRKDVGPICLLFLDTNDLVYGPAKEPQHPSAMSERGREGEAPTSSPAAVQMEWLLEQLRTIDRARTPTVIVVMHHPFMQSSTKHREQAIALWSYRHAGRTLVNLLADHGVDLVLTGHTHTYERFRLRRADGRDLAVVNLSGRPRASFLWIGDGARRAHSLEGELSGWMKRHGWHDVDGWSIEQEAAMIGWEADQYAVVEVAPEGGLAMQVHFLDPQGAGRERVEPWVRLK